MSIQFRSRISAQYTPIVVIGNTTTGWCCDSNQITTKAQCDSIGGYFAAGYTDNTGCPESVQCTGKLFLENPGACCYWEKNGEFYNQYCQLVEKEKDCLDLLQGSNEGLKYAFYPGSDCIQNGGDIKCNQVKVSNEDIQAGCNPNSSSGCFSVDNLLGNCCVKTSTGSIECSIKSKTECSGFWQSPVEEGGIYSCLDSSPCSGIYFPGLKGGLEPAKASLNKLSSSTNLLEKLPNIGDPYQGGIYLGIFKPGSPINTKGSIVYGNKLTGTPSDYIARSDTKGTKEKSWILICDLKDFSDFSYNVSGETVTELNNSLYDGLYNTYNNTTLLNDTIIASKINGFNDWYLPSQDELAFMFKNLSFGFSSKGGFEALQKEHYLTSTPFMINNKQSILGTYLIVAQMASEQVNYGKTIGIKRTQNSGIRLFRRIYLTD